MHQKYYPPSPGLVKYLSKELQALQPKEAAHAGGDVRFIRKKSNRTNIAKNKTDYVEKIFQAGADIVYFLEFIENHRELLEVFEKNLKDLFVNNDPGTRRSHHQNRGGVFERLIRASLLIDSRTPKELDFRVHLIKTLVMLSIDAMRSRISDINELNILEPSLVGIWSWGNLLSSRVPSDPVPAKHTLGFCTVKHNLALD